MTEIVLSIHKKWADKIFNGSKRFELRKTAPAMLDKFTAYLYETKPTGMIIGEIEIVEVHTLLTPFDACTLNHNGDFGMANYDLLTLIENNDYAECYLETHGEILSPLRRLYHIWYAWEIRTVIKYPYPRPLSDFGLTRAPQSWCYVKEIKK